MLALSDFSALKNFIRKPVHEFRSKFFQWFKITSNQLTVNDVICDVVFVNNNTANSLLMNFDCPVDTIRRASTHSSCHAELAPNQLPRFHCQRPVASKFTRLEPLGLPCLGAMLEAYHKRHPKPKTIAKLKEILQVIMDSLPQGPIDKAVKEFSKRLKACVTAEGGHFEHSQ